MTYKKMGILLDSSTYKGILQGHKKSENIEFYEEEAKHLNIGLLYFRVKDIKINEGKIRALVKNDMEKFDFLEVPIPKVIHNRIITKNVIEQRIIKSLIEQGVIVFNQNNGYPKYFIYKSLRKSKELLPYLPETVKADIGKLKYMMEKYDEIILKPNSGSLGNDIVILRKMDSEKWELTYRRRKASIMKKFSGEIPAEIKDMIVKNDILIQKRIRLAQYNSAPFDLRVSVQKNGMGVWQVTGIVGKVAAKGKLITNVAQGGSCYPLGELLQKKEHVDKEKVIRDIRDLSIKTAIHLENEGSHLADLGLDIGLTEDCKPMLIECNGRDLRYSFRNAKMEDEWKRTFTTPIQYADYLYRTNILEKKNN